MSAPHPEHDRASDQTPTSRRAFIGRAAAGAAVGGLVWAAPSILTVDAAAAGSCGTGTHTLNWGGVTNGTSPTSVLSTGGTPLTVGIATTQTTNTAHNGGLGDFDCFDVINSTIGGQSNKSYLLQMNVTAGGTRYVQVTFTFPAGTSVNGLSFQIFDIDYSTSYNFQDVITISGVNSAGTAATFSATPNTAYTRTGNPGTSVVLTGQNFGGNPSTGLAPSSNLGNATISSAQSIRSVTVRYSPGTPRDADPYQYVSIGNLTWTSCT